MSEAPKFFTGNFVLLTVDDEASIIADWSIDDMNVERVIDALRGLANALEDPSPRTLN